MSEETELARVNRVFEDALHVSAPAPDLDIIEAGLIDSLGLVTWVFELEREFDVEVPLGSLQIDDFRTLAGVVRTLARLRREASA
ncbi:MAG: phosphopantetheine-binding protein [Solirubrobacteraceae bacterium]